jgi:hypothetical protein
VSGARYFGEKKIRQIAALTFVRTLLLAPIDRIAIENPVSIISTKIRKPDQVIQPYMFGHGEKKRTCLWLKNLPILKPTDIVEGRREKILEYGPTSNRRNGRSKTYQGIAEAMAKQWGALDGKEK